MVIEVAVKELEPRESEGSIHMALTPLRGDARVSFMWGTEGMGTLSPERKTFSQDGTTTTSSATQSSVSVLLLITVLFVLLM